MTCNTTFFIKQMYLEYIIVFLFTNVCWFFMENIWSLLKLDVVQSRYCRSEYSKDCIVQHLRPLASNNITVLCTLIIKNFDQSTHKYIVLTNQILFWLFLWQLVLRGSYLCVVSFWLLSKISLGDFLEISKLASEYVENIEKNSLLLLIS